MPDKPMTSKVSDNLGELFTEYAKTICGRCRNGQPFHHGENKTYHLGKDGGGYTTYEECEAESVRNFMYWMARKGVKW